MTRTRYRVWYDKAGSDSAPWLMQREGSGEATRMQEVFFRNATLITSFIPEGHVHLQSGPRGVMVVEVDE